MPATILPRTGIRKPSAGQNPYFADLDATLQRLDDLSEWRVPPGASEADIVTALAAAHAAGGGAVVLAGSDYTMSNGTVAMSISLSTVELRSGNGVTVIHYTGNGVCLRVQPSTFTISRSQAVRGIWIDLAGAGPNAIGLQIRATNGMHFDNVTVINGGGAGNVGWDFNNPTGTWSERNLFTRCDSLYNTVNWRFGGAGTSYLYNDFSDCRFNCKPGQIGWQTVSPAQLFDCQLGVRGNMDSTFANPATAFDLQPGSLILRPQCSVTVEQTNGDAASAVAFSATGGEFVYPLGQISFPGFVLPMATIANYQGSGKAVQFVGSAVDRPHHPKQGLGLVVGDSILGAAALIYNGGAGNSFAVRQIGFGQTVADSVELVRLDGAGVTFLGDTAKRLGYAGNGVYTPTKMLAAGGLGSGGSSAATTPGSVIKKLPIYDDAGALLGYLPIYSSIT